MYMITIYIMTLFNARLGPPGPKTNFKEKTKALFSGGSFETVLVFAMVLGGLFIGWFTPTEAGAVGSACIILIGLVRRELNWKSFRTSLADTATTSAMVFLLVVGAEVFGSFMAMSRIPAITTTWVGDLHIPGVFILFIMWFFQLFFGCILYHLNMVQY